MQASRGEKTFYKVTVRVRAWVEGGWSGGWARVSQHVYIQAGATAQPCIAHNIRLPSPGQRHGHGAQGHPRHAGPRAERHQVRRQADARQVWAGRQDGAHLVRRRGNQLEAGCTVWADVRQPGAGALGQAVAQGLAARSPPFADHKSGSSWARYFTAAAVADSPHGSARHNPDPLVRRSKMSTGLPIEVTSARRGSASRSYYKLDLDIQRWVAVRGLGE